MRTAEYKELIYEEIMLYHEESAVHRYLNLKEECPEGYLWKRFGKERLRTMYKNDKELHIQGETVEQSRPGSENARKRLSHKWENAPGNKPLRRCYVWRIN